MKYYENFSIHNIGIEIWKCTSDINYLISSFGRIKSLKESKYGKNNNGVILKQVFDKGGYLRIGLSFNGKPKSFFVHRLVAKYFIPNPENKRTVNHINGVKTDNRIDNINWATYSEQNIHAYRILKRVSPCAGKGKFGKDSAASKKVVCINNEKEYESAVEAGIELNISNKCISNICRGKSRISRTGLIFKFA